MAYSYVIGSPAGVTLVAARKASCELFQIPGIHGLKLLCRRSLSGFVFDGSGLRMPRFVLLDLRSSWTGTVGGDVTGESGAAS